MAEVSLTTLKAYFENGKRPNEQSYIDLIDTLAATPLVSVSARVTRDSHYTSVPTGTWTAIPFNYEWWDTANLHSTTVNPTRLTFPGYGIYQISASISFAANTVGVRGVRFWMNGNTVIWAHFQNAATAYSTRISISALQNVEPNWYVECEVYQSSGANLTIEKASVYSPEFGAIKVGVI